MRKIVVSAFVSLDGVMQAPGGPEEDPSGGFEFGGWTVPYWQNDDVLGSAMGELFAQPFDLLLGRKTYDIFAAHWPHQERDPRSSNYDKGTAEISERFDAATKFVATHRPESLQWKTSRALGDDIAVTLRALKKEDGPILLVQGSSDLIRQLLAHDLVDELRLLTFPVILGRGKRWSAETSAPHSLKLTKSTVSKNGVVLTHHERAGEIATGSFAMAEPTAAELERRNNLR